MKNKLVKTICAVSTASLLISCQSKQVADNQGLQNKGEITPTASAEELVTPQVTSTEIPTKAPVQSTQQATVTSTPTTDTPKLTEKPESTMEASKETEKPQNTNSQSNSSAEAIKEVLKGKVAFLNVDGTIDGTYITQIKKIAGDNVETELKSDEFYIVDMDQDGQKEVVVRLTSGSKGYSLVLRYYDGKVYGYGFNLRAMGGITQNGVFNFSKGEKDSGWAQLKFDGTAVKTEVKAEYKNAESEYYVDGEEVSEEDFYSYSREKENEDEAPCYKLSESDIDTYVK